MYMLLIRLLLIIATIPSIIAVFNPLLAWKLREGWKFNRNTRPQPSDFYLLLTRIGGILSTIVCFIVFFFI